MIFGIIRGFLGEFGRAVLDFYLANSLIINAIILAYGFLVFVGHRNYYFALKVIMKEIGLGSRSDFEKKKQKISKSTIKKIEWENVNKSIKLPFISIPKKWSLVLCNEKFLRKEFTAGKLNEIIKQ